MLTIVFYFILYIYASYTFKKYSDFCYFGFYKIFQISCIMDGMGILENFENAWDIDFQTDYDNLSQKLFSETVCKDCETESTPIVEKDNMGRDIFWEQENLDL